MLHTAEDYKLPNGQIYHTYPSLKSAEDQKALWAGTLSGAINCVATDELCCTLREKTMGRRIDDTTGGNSASSRDWRHVYGDGGAARLLSLPATSTSVSTNAAKVMGLYPRKGRDRRSAAKPTSPSSIRTGAARCAGGPARDRYTPWEGHDIFAWPVWTMLRGKVVVENGRFLGREGAGPVPEAQDPGRDHRGSDAVTPNTVTSCWSKGLRAWRVTRQRRARGRRGAARHRRRQAPAHLAAPADLPFRWMVGEGERTRGATSIAGLLRNVRASVDPHYRPVRLRIVPLPLVPS
jgi:hypothetical protein